MVSLCFNKLFLKAVSLVSFLRNTCMHLFWLNQNQVPIKVNGDRGVTFISLSQQKQEQGLSEVSSDLTLGF